MPGVGSFARGEGADTGVRQSEGAFPVRPHGCQGLRGVTAMDLDPGECPPSTRFAAIPFPGVASLPSDPGCRD